MDIRKEGFSFGGDTNWDAFVHPPVQKLLAPWRDLIENNAATQDKSWLPAFPVVVYSVVRCRVTGEASPHWPFDNLYRLVPRLVAGLFDPMTAFLLLPPEEWDLDRMIATWSQEFVDFSQTVRRGEPLRLISYGELASQIAIRSKRYPNLTADYVRKCYAELRKKRQALWRDWSGAIWTMPAFSLGANAAWLKMHEDAIKAFVVENRDRLCKCC